MPNQLTARRHEHSVNIVPPDGATSSALKVQIDRMKSDIAMATATQPVKENPAARTPNQLTAQRPEHSVNIVPLDRTTLSALKVLFDRIECDLNEINEIFTLISPRKKNSTAHEAARHMNVTDHVQTDASSSRDSAGGSTRSSSDAGGLEVIPDSSVGKMITFNLDMREVPSRKRKRRSEEEQKQTNEIRSRGACDECRSRKRQVCHVHAKIYSSLDA